MWRLWLGKGVAVRTLRERSTSALTGTGQVSEQRDGAVSSSGGQQDDEEGREGFGETLGHRSWHGGLATEADPARDYSEHRVAEPQYGADGRQPKAKFGGRVVPW